MRQICVITVCVVVAFVIFILGWIVWDEATKTTHGLGVMDRFSPIPLPSSVLVRNLENRDREVVFVSLSILADRADPIAISRAIEFLESDDPYLWLNAAIYLGACGRSEAVPYLIKSLRHTASRGKDKRAKLLHSITHQEFGTSFSDWREWWIRTYPEKRTFDFDSHLGANPKLGQ